MSNMIRYQHKLWKSVNMDKYNYNLMNRWLLMQESFRVIRILSILLGLTNQTPFSLLFHLKVGIKRKDLTFPNSNLVGMSHKLQIILFIFYSILIILLIFHLI